MTPEQEIKNHCYNKWLQSNKTWNHYLASRLLEKQEMEKL